MNEEEKKAYKKLIDSYKESHIDDDKHGFNAALSRNISVIVEKFYDILVKYFSDYSEDQFHERMKQIYIIKDKKTNKMYKLVGFDFCGDFRKYHKLRFVGFIHSVRLVKKWFILDRKKIYDIMLEMLKIKGWKVYDHEKTSINNSVTRIYNIIYHSRDTIEELD